MTDGVQGDLDIGALRDWIGRQEEQHEQISDRLVRQFRATFDLPGEGAAASPAPLMIQWCLAQTVAGQSALAEDGHPTRGGFLPPVPLPRRMWAAGRLRFRGPLRCHDRVTRRSRIVDVTAKTGRSGPLCFVAVDHEYSVEGRPVLCERQDIVYRGDGRTPPAAPPSQASPSAKSASEASPSGQTASAAAPPPAPLGTHSERITPSAALLMRYSALTFNAHRIHYDLDYARSVEGYPGLIVHGPLQATLLCRLAARVKGGELRRFAFRSLAPITDRADFTINAEQDGDVIRLWTAQAGGPVAMRAEAQ